MAVWVHKLRSSPQHLHASSLYNSSEESPSVYFFNPNFLRKENCLVLGEEELPEGVILPWLPDVCSMDGTASKDCLAGAVVGKLVCLSPCRLESIPPVESASTMLGSTDWPSLFGTEGVTGIPRM